MPTHRAFICPHCAALTSSDVLGIATSGNPENGPPAEFALLQCGNVDCEMPIVQVREDYGQGFDADSPAIYFPAPRRLSWSVPVDLRSAFSEVVKCFQVKAYEATVVMVRRLLEGTCQHQGSTKRRLIDALEELKTKGIIDERLAEWAHLLRTVGNSGAHYSTDQVTREDAQDSMDFAEALLDHIYVLSSRFEDFKLRHPK